MYINLQRKIGWQIPHPTKTLLLLGLVHDRIETNGIKKWIMRAKLTIFILILSMVHLSASTKAQKITLSLKNASLTEVLSQIKSQSGYDFVFYSGTPIKNAKSVSIEVRNANLDKTLKKVFEEQTLTYKLESETIVILEKAVLRNASPRPIEGQQELIRGRVVNDKGEGLAGATIHVLNTEGNRTSIQTLSDDQGNFQLDNQHKGNVLEITYIGFKSQKEIANIQMGTIELQPILTEVDEIVIVGQKPLITRSIDKLILNVEGSIYEKGENGLRLFNAIPGVQVTAKDIVFRGSEKVTVYIDNRRIILPDEQILGYLRTIPSESIKSYELKAVPGAENDAQNGGVIVNIVLKSEYKFGLSGNMSSGFWRNDYNNGFGAASANYRVGKVTLQGNFNYRNAVAFYEDDIDQEFKSTYIYNPQSERYVEKYNTFNYNFGLDYRLTDKQTVGVNYNGYTNPLDFSNNTTTNAAFLTNRNASLIDSSWYSAKSTRYSYTSQMANTFYRNKLDTMGSKLDLGYSYVQYTLDDPSAVETKFLNNEGIESRPRDSVFAHDNGKSSAHVVNIDLEKYIEKTLVISLGGKYTASKTDYSMNYHFGLNGDSPSDSLRSNRFLYNEKILAFYGTIGKSFKNWQIKAGLRTEKTIYDGESLTTGQTITRNRWDFFPSAYVSRKIGNEHSFTFSYARRIIRPGFRQLNPFVFYTSLNNIQEGNPDLVPFYGNNMQLEYLLKSKYSFTIGYQNTDDGIAKNIESSGDVIISRDENINNNNNVFLSAHIPVKLTNWWEINVNSTFRNTTIDIQTTPIVHRSKFSQNYWANSKFNLPGKYYLEISGSHNRNQFSGIFDAINTWKVDIYLKKSFFNEKLTTTIELQDPLHLYKPGQIINTDLLTRKYIRNKLDFARYVGVFFTYNFSAGKKQSNRENITTGGNEVRGRL